MADHTKALQRISKAKTSLILGHPFVGTIALNMPTRIDETIPTACTNGKEIRYNPAFVASLSDAELTFLVAHECMHPMLEHNYRRGARNPLRWNKACISLDSFVLLANGTEIRAEDVRPGDVLWSPTGPSVVYECVYKGLKPVLRLDSKYGTSYATYDHKFLRDGGWNATIQGAGVYQDFYGVPGSARVYFAELQNNVDKRFIGSDYSILPQRSCVFGEERFDGRSVYRETTLCCDGENSYIGATSIFSRDCGRRGDYFGYHQDNRAEQTAYTSVCDYSNNVDPAGRVVGSGRFHSGEKHKFERTSVLAMHMVRVCHGYDADRIATVLSDKEEASTAFVGAYIASSQAIKKLGSSGAYARYCCDTSLAERTQVIARREDTQREVVDFITSEHVFVVGGLVSHNCDYAINELLVQEGIGTFIKGGLHNTALYTAGKGIAEAIYDLLPEEDNAAGAGSPGTIGGTGVDLEDATGSAAEVAQAQAEMKVKVAQAAQAAKMAGKLSQRMRELVDQVLQPKVDWRAVLRTFVEKCRDDSRTWSRFNRRFLPQGLYLPSVSGERMGTIVVACDCSGSVSAQVIAEFAAEIRAIHQDTKPAALHVVYFDSEVLHRDDYTPEDVPEIIRHGGGGTAFSPIFKHVEAEGLNPVACVVLTDLICSDFGQQPDYPVLWVSTELDQAPWGQVIKM